MRQYVKDKMPKDQEELNDMIKLASIQVSFQHLVIHGMYIVLWI